MLNKNGYTPLQIRKKRLRIITIVCIVALVASTTMAFAGWWQDLTGWVQDTFADVGVGDCSCDAVDGTHAPGRAYPCTNGWSGFQVFAYNMETNVATGHGGGSLSYDVFYILDISTDAEGNYTSAFGKIWASATEVGESFMVVGILLVFLYFLIDIIDKMTSETINAEILFKQIIKLFVAILVIMNCMKILELGVHLSNSLTRMIIDRPDEFEGAGSFEAIREELYSAHMNYTWLDSLGAMLGCIIPWILSLIPTLLILITLYSRWMEIGVRTIIAPVAVANLFDGGSRSSGIRFVKKFVSACLQGFIIAGIMTVYYIACAPSNIAVANPFANVLGGVGIPLLVLLAVCPLIFKAKQFADDIVGV